MNVGIRFVCDDHRNDLMFQGHNKPITAMAVSDDQSTVYTAGVDGEICILYNCLSILIV